MRLLLVTKGGKGSGDAGHSGRPGKVGGSLPGKGKHEHHHEHRKKRSYHFHHHHHDEKKVEEKKPKQLSFLPKPEKPKKVEEPGFTDDEIPKGWTKFSHEAISRGDAVKKVFIVRSPGGKFSMQRRYLGSALLEEYHREAPSFSSLDKAIREAEKWLGE